MADVVADPDLDPEVEKYVKKYGEEFRRLIVSALVFSRKLKAECQVDFDNGRYLKDLMSHISKESPRKPVSQATDRELIDDVFQSYRGR